MRTAGIRIFFSVIFRDKRCMITAWTAENYKTAERSAGSAGARAVPRRGGEASGDEGVTAAAAIERLPFGRPPVGERRWKTCLR